MVKLNIQQQYENYETIFDGIRYLITLKSNISDIYSDEYTKIKINSDNDLPFKKNTMHYAVILTKSVFNENHNHQTIKCFQKNVHINNIKILYYNRIVISEGTDVNKSSSSKECIICHYWYFKDKRFTFQSFACNCCHDALMMSINLNNIAILNIRSAVYCWIINIISESEAINLLEKVNVGKKSGSL